MVTPGDYQETRRFPVCRCSSPLCKSALCGHTTCTSSCALFNISRLLTTPETTQMSRNGCCRIMRKDAKSEQAQHEHIFPPWIVSICSWLSQQSWKDRKSTVCSVPVVLSLANLGRSSEALGSHNLIWNVLKSSRKWHVYTINASSMLLLLSSRETACGRCQLSFALKRWKGFLLDRHRKWCCKAKRWAFVKEPTKSHAGGLGSSLSGIKKGKGVRRFVASVRTSLDIRLKRPGFLRGS